MDNQTKNKSLDEVLYPPIEPDITSVLNVGGLHKIYYEQSGNPKGMPALFLHGGPGSKSRPVHRRYFDPEFYRIVLMDQRGCGRSRPLGETSENTTDDLVEDIEKLRLKLRIDKWIILGGSWGSALALAYAARFPDSVSGLILRGVFLARQQEIEWYLNGVRKFVPESVCRLQESCGVDAVSYYHQLLNTGNKKVVNQAAQEWSLHESVLMGIGNKNPEKVNLPAVDSELIASVKIQLHYLKSNCFLDKPSLLERVGVIKVPTVIIQGRLDMTCPPETAYDLAQVLPNNQLRVVEVGGHSGLEPEMARELCLASNEMKTVRDFK